MGGFAELEVALSRFDGQSATASLRFSPPGSDGDVLVADDVALTFDLAALDGLVHDAEGYGRALGTMVLVTEVAGAVARASQEAGSKLVPLRLRLFVTRTAEPLHRLRWETLRDPASGECLFTSENMLFSRYLASTDWRPVGESPRAGLRALVAVANPKGLEEWQPGGQPLAPVQVEDELARARAALGTVPHTELASGGAATLDGIVAGLADGPELFYLVCHGFLAGDDPQLLLEAADGGVSRVSGSDLITRLRELRQRPRLVVLASCQSAGAGTDSGALAGLGPRLAELGVPAVLAMQGNVSMATIATFMPAFFAELDRDGQIDRAVAVARGRVRDNVDWWMPVLFMRLRSGRLWSTEPEPAPPPATRPPWDRSKPADLATYATPDARRWLTLGRSSYDLGETPEGRLDTLRAIYAALSQRGVAYAPGQETGSTVPVRTPEQVLVTERKGAALDLAALFSGLCLGNRLLPVVVLLGDHPLVLVSLASGTPDRATGAVPEQGLFASGVAAGEESFDRLVQLVDTGTLVAMECSGFARADGASASAPHLRAREDGLLPFDRARSAARERLVLERDHFAGAVDVAWLQRFGRKVPYLEADERPAAAVVRRETKAPPAVFGYREGELDRLQRIVLSGDRRVGVISGMPGVGKSSLVAAFADNAAVEQAFPDGTLYIDLTATDVMAALEHVAQAFGQSVAEHDELSSRVAIVRSVLQNHGARVLIVVDDATDPDVVDVFRFRDGGLLVTTVDEQLGDQPGAVGLRVDPLSTKDAVALLGALVTDDLGSRRDSVLHRVAASLGGLPLALALAASLVSKGLATGSDLDEVLADLESRRLDLGPRDRPVRAVFDTTYERALDQQRRDLFARLGAFGGGRLSLDAIAAAWDLEPTAAGRHLRALTELSLVDCPERGCYELQPLLRDYAVAQFAQLPAADQLVVHQRAADFYRVWLRSFEETNVEQTLCWYRFEQKEWQDAKSRYLFHLSHLPDRVIDRLAYTGLFFDAFWWWGSYVRFEYGDQLLLEWERSRCTDADDRRWFEAMKAFVRTYPLGPNKSGAGEWVAARDALLSVRELSGLAPPSPITDADERRHVAAITDQFLGQCHRYLGDGEAAARSYEESIARLEAGNEWWEVAWAQFAYADLELGRGRPEDAARRAQAALDIDLAHRRADLDVELRANLYRVEADVAWAAGDQPTAFRSYGLAGFYAYRLQASAHPPDLYALAFYREMKGHLAGRLGELVDAGQLDQASSGLAEVAALWAPYWTAAGTTPKSPLLTEGVAAAVEAVLPPEPSERKLTTRSVRYRQQFAREVAERTAAIAAQLDKAAWPDT